MLSKVKPMKKTEDICVFSKGSLDSRGKANIISKYFPQNIVPVDGLVRKRNDRFDDTVYGERNTHITNIQATNYPTNVLHFDIEMNEERYHPTQKPQQLLEYLIKTYTKEGDLVLDNCMGSGSTGVACKTLNRDFIGIELDKNYFNIAEQRISNHRIKNELW